VKLPQGSISERGILPHEAVGGAGGDRDRGEVEAGQEAEAGGGKVPSQHPRPKNKSELNIFIIKEATPNFYTSFFPFKKKYTVLFLD
jgi:hypothetical protein